jgi:hypothetical protein
MPKITARMLKAKGACASQVEKFKELFPFGSAEVTIDLCVKHAADFDWIWAAENLLNSAAKAEYERVRAEAWAEYQRVRAGAWATAFIGQESV